MTHHDQVKGMLPESTNKYTLSLLGVLKTVVVTVCITVVAIVVVGQV